MSCARRTRIADKVVCANANAKPACANGVCQLQACNTGYADCDGNPANGCEVNLTNDAKNCGKCGVACQNVNSCVMGACDNRTRVLLLASDYAVVWPDVQKGLLATGAFSVVDYFDVSKGTPTLVQLQGYDAVLLWTFQGFLDPQTTGDRMADYWDGGGRVVLALDGYALKGRFGTVANGYRLLQAPFSVDAIMESMATPFEPQSLLVAGVTRIDAVQAWRAVGGGVVNGGIVVAEWGTTHQPLIVRGVVKGRNRVDLNFYPPSDAAAMLKQFRSWTGDGFVLLKNALLYK